MKDEFISKDCYTILKNHNEKLEAIKDWIDATHASLNVLEEAVEKLLGLTKDDSGHILEHEQRLRRLEGMLDERYE